MLFQSIIETRIIRILSLLIILIFGFLTSRSEGTKQIRPLVSDVGNIEINDQGRPFALESNSDPLHRLYFHISNVSEKVYFGFQHVGAGAATFRIKDPSGTVVYARTSVPTTGSGYINTYDEAIAGPKISGVPAGGYNPLLFTPATTGDFYIEFTTDLSGTYHFDLFDLTVTDASNNPIDGRLWSYAWDFSTRSASGRYNGDLYVYTDDGYVSKVDMNGIQPWGFVVSCNNSGPSNTDGGNNENRKSVDGNSTRPQYKIFFNNPDINCYPNGSTPSVIENLSVVGTPEYGQPIHFSLNMSMGGTLQIVLDINGVAGYQANSADVIIVENVSSGVSDIVWDGKDGFGNYVEGATVLVLSSFTTGVTHLPLYDPENHSNGYQVSRVRPFTGACELYWDDSNFTGGTVNIDGALTTGHSWTSNFGNIRTMNTWWNGYELDVLNNFQFDIPVLSLPIDLLYLNAIPEEDKVKVEWTTASETNNAYFVLERSTNLDDYSQIALLSGAGNSNSPKSYFAYDEAPVSGTVYYRIKQIDFDGTYTYSRIVACTPVLKSIILLNRIVERNSVISMQLSNPEEVSRIDVIDGNSVLLSTQSEVGSKTNLQAPSNSGLCFIKVDYIDRHTKIFKLMVY